MVAGHLVGIVALAWASATFVALITGHLRDDRRPTLAVGDLACGLPFWLWVAVFAVLFDLLERVGLIWFFGPLIF